jgi:hypothetical protein
MSVPQCRSKRSYPVPDLGHPVYGTESVVLVQKSTCDEPLGGYACFTKLNAPHVPVSRVRDGPSDDVDSPS